jgi:FAD/FMN-containing dehydrogenase
MPAAGMSWGRWPRYEHRALVQLHDRAAGVPAGLDGPLLPYGNGRSYGDVCLNRSGTLLTTRGLDRFISFDPEQGTLECESGVLLSDIIDLVLPRGWFPAVTPGTSFVTVGGAIANDVHGKNHHLRGCFSHHVLDFSLRRSDGTAFHCTPLENREWFAATVGGLGLTGLITRAKMQLRRVPGVWLRGDSQRFANLEEFFELSAQSDADYEYSAAWIDCAATGSALGRGVFTRGNHAPGDKACGKEKTRHMRVTPPISLVNRLSLKAFNQLYYWRGSAVQRDALWHYRPFLYPLDSVTEWNRMYGPRGFFQYQCVLPEPNAKDSVQEILKTISKSRIGSFLAVLKKFGNAKPLGLLSFARPGTTLALDFPNQGALTMRLLESLDAITRSARGAVYPAKDANMSAAAFRDYYPAWQEFERFIDPKFSSSFWRRVTGAAA